MQTKIAILQNRSIISISGGDAKKFLQGLVTNDVNKVSEKQAIYALMLNPQGRFLYDFFIIQSGEKLLIDCDKTKCDEIIQKLSFYKLRSKIEIQKEEDFLVAFSTNFSPDFIDEAIIFPDPRNSEMGLRIFAKRIAIQNNISLEQDGNFAYNSRRFKLKMPDDSDLTFDQSFPLEFGFDNFNAIDYQKGCYTGQETTARMHYKSVIRKKVFLVEILNCAKIEKSSNIEVDGKKIGEILSSIVCDNKLLAMALIKNLDNEGKEIKLHKLNLASGDKKIIPNPILNS